MKLYLVLNTSKRSKMFLDVNGQQLVASPSGFMFQILSQYISGPTEPFKDWLAICVFFYNFASG